MFNVGHHMICDSLNVPNLYQKVVAELSGMQYDSPSYEDYLKQHSEYKESAQFDKDDHFWQEKISDEMPLAFGWHPIGKCNNVAFCLPDISDFCSKNNVTESAFVYTITALLLLRLQDIQSVSLGIPILGRTSFSDLNALGLYMNNMPVVVQRRNKSFIEMLKEVESQLFDVFRHQQYDLPQGTLFDVSVDYSTYPTSSDYSANVLYNDFISTAAEFHFLKNDRLELTIRCQDRVFRNLNAIKESLVLMVESIFNNPNQSVNTIPIASLHKECETNAFPRESVYSLIEKQLDGSIIDCDKTIPISQLKKDALKIDAAVRGKKRVVAIICDRGYCELAAIYGIIRGGNAYLPISPYYPNERIQLMIDQCRCDTVLVERRFKNIVPNALVIEDLLHHDEVKNPPACKATPEDTLYVIFTSGTTGKPKGAMVSNQSVVNRIKWMVNRYFNSNTIVMRKTPFTFDVSVWEIFGFAIGGFTRYILPPEFHYKNDKVIEHIAHGKVTDIHFVPTVFSSFLEATKSTKTDFSSVRNIFLSGEILPASLVNSLPVKMHNLYGPTECAVDVTFYDCMEDEEDPVPIGKAIDNCSIYILDENLQPMPKGVTGQICIGGVGVGKGYINDSIKTKKVFIPNPFGSGNIYLTGDYGYQREDGLFIFVGRKDHQVKINGQRIELEEIETAMSSLVDSSIVVVEGNKLVAYYTGEKHDDLRKMLSQKLPRYMVPNIFVHVEELPKTGSGKKDRISIVQAANKTEVSPSEKESLICELFAQVLRIDSVSRSDDFFRLGGTSLEMIEVLSNELLSDISASYFFSHPTAAELANPTIDNNHIPEVLYAPTNPTSGIVLFPYAGGDEKAYASLVQEFRQRQATVALFFVPWGTDYDIASREISALAQKMKITFYSHCAGSVIALEILDRINNSSRVIDRYFVAASVPPILKRNVWRTIPKKLTLKLLHQAGMPVQSPEIESSILANFMSNTDMFFEYFRNKHVKTPISIDLILGKNDIFTKHYSKPAKSWQKYIDGINTVTVLATSNHYFQSAESRKLADVLLEAKSNVT